MNIEVDQENSLLFQANDVYLRKIRQEDRVNTKLTLRLDEDIIIRMKNYAGRQQISLSKFTENIFKQILDSTEEETQKLSPIVKKYKGILNKSNINEAENLIEILTEKHS